METVPRKSVFTQKPEISLTTDHQIDQKGDAKMKAGKILLLAILMLLVGAFAAHAYSTSFEGEFIGTTDVVGNLEGTAYTFSPGQYVSGVWNYNDSAPTEISLEVADANHFSHTFNFADGFDFSYMDLTWNFIFNNTQLQYFTISDGTNTLTDDIVTPPVPIPAAVWLLGAGLIGLFGIRRRIHS